jgi:hypothetical protein
MRSDTARCCEIYLTAVAAGEDTTAVVGQLATWFDVQRPAIWKRLRRGGAVPAYKTLQVRQKRRTKSEVFQARAEAPRVDRDPCPRCGVRGDLPCKHNRTWLGTSF